jgi:chorismate mutase
MTLDELRRHLDDLDRRLLELIAERQRTGREIARVKRSTGRGTRDYGRERDVILAARANAARVGVPPDTAEELMRLLIRTSLTTQEQASVAALGSGAGQRVLVIGGQRNGGWFVQFLSSQASNQVATVPVRRHCAASRLHSSDLSDFIIVARRWARPTGSWRSWRRAVCAA